MRAAILILLFFPALIYGQATDTAGYKSDNKADTLLYNTSHHNLDKSLGLVMGVSQFNYTFLELGIASVKERRSDCAFGYHFRGLSLSAEYRPYADPEQHIGFLLTSWHNAGLPLSWGINLNTYTNFEGIKFGIRPMLGIGIRGLQLVYGYNIHMENYNRVRVNKHNISLRVYVKMFGLARADQ